MHADTLCTGTTVYDGAAEGKPSFNDYQCQIWGEYIKTKFLGNGPTITHQGKLGTCPKLERGP